MTLAERIRALAEALPTQGATVQLSKADLLAMLEEAGAVAAVCGNGSQSGDQEHLMDLSVNEIMEATGRARSTVTGWINNGELDSYMFGREHRVTRAAWNDFLARRRGGRKTSDQVAPEPAVEDLSSWRSVAVGGNR